MISIKLSGIPLKDENECECENENDDDNSCGSDENVDKHRHDYDNDCDPLEGTFKSFSIMMDVDNVESDKKVCNYENDGGNDFIMKMIAKRIFFKPNTQIPNLFN